MNAAHTRSPAGHRRHRVRLLATALALGIATAAGAVPLTVIDARGGAARPGQKVDSGTVIVLNEGERMVLVAPDGRIMALKGPYRGPAARTASAVQDQRAALSALIALRNQRANSVGAVRSGADAQPMPDPWLIDISRPGERCLLEGSPLTWWRPQAEAADRFSIIPVDRSWRADFTWSAGQDRMDAPAVARLISARSFVVRQGRRELPIRINVIPAHGLEPLVLGAWLLEKGCVQQADALFARLAPQVSGTPDAPAAPATDGLSPPDVRSP